MAAYLVALLLVGGSVTVGYVVCAASGGSGAASPAVGFAALIVVATFAVRLPGRAATSAVVVLLVLVASIVFLVRTRRFPLLGLPAVLTGGAAAAVGALPFLSAGSVGIPGVSLNNDTGVHLLWAEGLRSDEMHRFYPANPGYPLGPHSLLATLATGTGVDMDRAMTALVIAIPVLAALTAFGALRRSVPLPLAVPASVLVAFSYLQAAWYGQGAFKEPSMALLLLGFVLALAAVLRADAAARARAAAPLGLVVAGTLLVYSYLGVVWLGLAGLFLLASALLVGRGPKRVPVATALRAAVPPAAVAAGVALLGVAVELPRLWRYATSIGASPASGGIAENNLGNLPKPLQGSEALGIWPVADWRFPPDPGTFLLQEWKLLVLAAVVGGAVVLVLRRREPALPAALGAAGIVAALSSYGQSPYVTAKALTILAPFVTIVVAQALLGRRTGRGQHAATLHGASMAIGIALLLAGAASAVKVLRWSPVESPAQREQLEALRPALGDGPTLVLVADDYAGWRLRGVRVAYVGGLPSPTALEPRATRPYALGQPLDWDSVTPAKLDAFDSVVTARGAYSSQPPPNFRLVKRTPLFAVWRRTGPTPPREVVEPAGEPFAALDCRSPQGRALRSRGGTASILPTAPIRLASGLPPLIPGVATPVPVALPRGKWSLSVQYIGQVPVRLQVGRRALELPANTNRPGTWWPGLSIRSDGRPQQLLVIAERASRVTPTTIAASVSGIVAVRQEPRRRVPLRQACGRVVDWYRPAGAGAP